MRSASGALFRVEVDGSLCGLIAWVTVSIARIGRIALGVGGVCGDGLAGDALLAAMERCWRRKWGNSHGAYALRS